MNHLNEALKPSEWREFKDYIKGWNKDRYHSIFSSPEHEHNRKAYRVYLPMIGGGEIIHPPKQIEKFLKRAGYKVADYAKGLAQNIQNPKRQIKIGKLLAKQPELLKKFQDDPKRRSAKGEYEVVITRHPYDLLGMSTNRGWTSCMNLKTDETGHTSDMGYRHIPMDIKHGTIAAYAIPKGKTPEQIRDQRNLKSPVARVLIKPFINIEDDQDIMLGIEDRVYGTPPSGFLETVLDWVNWVDDTDNLSKTIVAKLPDRLATDDEDGDMHRIFPSKDDKEGDFYDRQDIDNVKADPHSIQYIKEPSELTQLYAVKTEPSVIQYIEYPTDKVQILAISDDPTNFEFINNPSEKIQLIAVKSYGTMIKHIENPSEAVQLAAVEDFLRSIYFISNPTEKVQLYVVKKAPGLIGAIERPTEKTQILAITKDLHLIEKIKNPTQNVIDYFTKRYKINDKK